jgi:hypothetical protein
MDANIVKFAEIGIGVLVGWGLNSFALHLSDKIQGFMDALPMAQGHKAWVGWIIALLIFGLVAGGGLYVPHIEGLGGVSQHLGNILVGIGVGGIIDELFHPPSIDDLKGK